MTQKQRSTIPRSTAFEISRKIELWYYSLAGFATRTYMGHEANELYGKSYQEVFDRIQKDPDLKDLEGVSEMAISILRNLARKLDLPEWKHECYPRKVDAKVQAEFLNVWLEEHPEVVFELLRPLLDEWIKDTVEKAARDVDVQNYIYEGPQ